MTAHASTGPTGPPSGSSSSVVANRMPLPRRIKPDPSSAVGRILSWDSVKSAGLITPENINFELTRFDIAMGDRGIAFSGQDLDDSSDLSELRKGVLVSFFPTKTDITTDNKGVTTGTVLATRVKIS